MKTCALLRRSSAVVALLLVGGCATQAGIEERPTESAEGTVGSVASELGAFDPCSPEWQLPTADRQRSLVSSDETFLKFEDRLEAGEARWIGRRTKDDAEVWRAVVRLDHYLEYTKKDPHSGLWYLASIDVGRGDARSAVDEFAARAPVNSRVLGYCLVNGGGFIADHGSGPGAALVKQIIVEYDPRCVCVSTSYNMQVWVDRPTYDTTP